MTAVLVVDDDPLLRRLVARNLMARGYDVARAADGVQALEHLGHARADLVILDVQMPRMDGVETCRRIRASSTVPIIGLTALDAERDRVTFLDQGADDCLVKPFGVDELLARVRSALRRVRWSTEPAPRRALRHRDLDFDLVALRVRLAGRELELTRTERVLLRYLMENAGKALPHARILRHVWGPSYREETQYVRVYVNRLRRKIETDPAHPEYLVTQRGVGYRFGG